MMKSKYTLIVEDFPEKGKHLLYSTRTQAMVVVDQELRDTINQLPDTNGGKKTADVLTTLSTMGFVIHDMAEDKRHMEEYFHALKNDSRIIQATVLTTYACNFGCTYCVEEGVKAAVHMNAATASRSVAFICKRVQEHQPDSLFVSFYGGEPLLNLKAIRVVAGGLHEFCRVHDLPFSFGMTTNGALLTPEVVEELVALGLKGVKVTLDGFREYHNRKRPFLNGKGSFDRIVQNVLLAVDKIDVDIGGNFDEENIDSFPDLLDYLIELRLDHKVHAVRFKPISETLTDRHEIPARTEIGCVYSDPSTAEHMVKLRQLAIEKGFRTDPGVGVNVCSMTVNNAIFTIDPKGKIFKCPALVGHNEFEVGTIFSDEIPIDAPEQLWERCLDCVYLPLCGEGCQFGAFVRYGDPYRLNCQKNYMEHMVRENLKLNYLYRHKQSG